MQMFIQWRKATEGLRCMVPQGTWSLCQLVRSVESFYSLEIFVSTKLDWYGVYRMARSMDSNWTCFSLKRQYKCIIKEIWFPVKRTFDHQLIATEVLGVFRPTTQMARRLGLPPDLRVRQCCNYIVEWAVTAYWWRSIHSGENHESPISLMLSCGHMEDLW